MTAHTALNAALQDHRRAVTRHCRADEAAAVAALVDEFRAARPDPAAVEARGRLLVRAVRARRRGASGVDNLMHEFSLSSQEGIALMCLAEALLRIPDSATVDRLIRDKLAHGDWRGHLGHSDSLFVNAATWGLMITGALVSTHREASLGSTLTRLLARGGEPVIRRGVEFALGLLGQQFVMGETIAAALERSEANIARGYSHSFDMLGEAALTTADAARYFESYQGAIHAIGRSGVGGVVAGPGISVKLSALHPRYSRAQRGRVLAELYPRLLALARLACGYSIGFNIDAEEAERLELSLELVERLAAEPALAGWDGLGVVVQAYQRRAPWVIDYLAQLARVAGRRIMVRLVKGAYWDSEIKRAQVDGQAGYPVFTRKPHTDLCYLVCAARLLAAADVIYPQFATHNAQTLASVEQMAAERGVANYEFQCLHGMGEALYDNVVAPGEGGRRCRIYAPVGRHETLLPYLVRRLLENGANSSFVNRIVDDMVAEDDLLAEPLDQVLQAGGQPHPAIPLPRDLYGAGRVNSAGLDLADEHTLARLSAELQRLARVEWQAGPLLASGAADIGPCLEVRNPADRRDRVGRVVCASPEDIDRALQAALDAADAWAARPAAERAGLLRKAADALEAATPELISLCVREAGKTWPNAVAEIREAVDFCRYYAAAAESLPPPPAPPGPVACISPWNFPLAIFVGEVAAALAAGSPVLAKPAEQTPLIAAEALRLFHAAGVPLAVLQLLPGAGETVGAALVADPRVRGVIFTGSTEVARHIHRSLAARPAGQPQPRLIAETGGQNAMIVDSSALAEQVVQDVIASGFDSAGQRCSALRVLCLQDDIAGRVLEMLEAAMGELAIGNPASLATDVGPVIDEAARAALLAHIERMRVAGCRVFQCALQGEAEAGCFVPPTLIEIDSLAALTGEVFGPVVHVLRYPATGLDALVEAINATGYGLTFGMHSRIDERIEAVSRRIRAGNVYVNRNMVGAVVGVQPFGGEGLSGTGPKAGGPLYLVHLMGLANLPPEALGLVRRPGADALPAAFAALDAWATAPGREALAGACRDYRAASLLGWEARLPGPTGETNRLFFVPRGEVRCRAGDEAALLEQLAAVLACGNTPVLDAGTRLPAGLPAEVAGRLQRLAPGETRAVAVVLAAGDDGQLAGFRREAAAASGPLQPVIGADPRTGRYPLHRLCAERVVTVNTTAAGGNTSLMTLAG